MTLNLKVQFFWDVTRVAAQIVLDVSERRDVFTSGSYSSRRAVWRQIRVYCVPKP